MAYGRKRKRSSYPGSSKRGRKVRRSTRRSYRRTRRRSSRYNAAMSTKVVTAPTRGVNLRTLGLPRKMVVHMPYRQYGQLQASIGACDNYQFRMNSLFDPDYTGVGSQPRYFDQLCSSTLYRFYRVYRTDYTVTFRNRGSDDCMVGVRIRPDITLPTGPLDMFYDAEMPYTATRMLNGVSDGGDRNRTVFKGSIKHAKFRGLSSTTFYGDPDYEGAFNVSPVSITMLSLSVANDPNEATASPTVDFEVTMVMHAILYDLPNEVAQS